MDELIKFIVEYKVVIFGFATVLFELMVLSERKKYMDSQGRFGSLSKINFYGILSWLCLGFALYFWFKS